MYNHQIGYKDRNDIFLCDTDDRGWLQGRNHPRETQGNRKKDQKEFSE